MQKRSTGFNQDIAKQMAKQQGKKPAAPKGPLPKRNHGYMAPQPK